MRFLEKKECQKKNKQTNKQTNKSQLLWKMNIVPPHLKM